MMNMDPERRAETLGPLTPAELADWRAAEARLGELTTLMASLRVEFEALHADVARAVAARQKSAHGALKASSDALDARKATLDAEGYPLAEKIDLYGRRAAMHGQATPVAEPGGYTMEVPGARAHGAPEGASGTARGR